MEKLNMTFAQIVEHYAFDVFGRIQHASCMEMTEDGWVEKENDGCDPDWDDCIRCGWHDAIWYVRREIAAMAEDARKTIELMS